MPFLEAPESLDEMRRYRVGVEGPKMANLIEGGKTAVDFPGYYEEEARYRS